MKTIIQFIKEEIFSTTTKWINPNKIRNNGKYIESNFPQEFKSIIETTSFLNYLNPKFSQRLWHLYNNKLDVVLCEWCKTDNMIYKDFKNGYTLYCCHQCYLNNKINTIEKRENTCIERYGVDYYHNKAEKYKITYNLKSDEEKNKIREKCKSVWMEKYGVDNPLKVPSIVEKGRQTKLDLYGDINYSNRLKYKQTCIERYGVENVSHVAEIVKRNLYKHHPFTLPSGKKIKLQGYEPRALKLLLTDYHEDDILYKKSDVPEIWYLYNKKYHRYYPDFYIPMDNLVIEVKSNWTLNLDLDKNKMKFKATKDMGFNFKLMVID